LINGATFTATPSISTAGPPITGIPLIGDQFPPAFISSIVPFPVPPAAAEKSLLDKLTTFLSSMNIVVPTD